MRLEIIISLPIEGSNAVTEKRYSDLLEAQHYYGSCLLIGKSPSIRLVVIND